MLIDPIITLQDRGSQDQDREESPEAGGAQSMYSGYHGALVFNASWEARME